MMTTSTNISNKSPETYVYIDGFNLYYGALRDTPYRWLDLERFCANLLKGHKVIKIKYFTARVSARVDDLDAPLRQRAYLKALETLPKVEIYYGHFKTGVKRMRLAHTIKGSDGQPVTDKDGDELQTVKVLKTEEKGSDVNLATHILFDAFKDRYDCAVLVSNDTDLESPIRLVKEEFKKNICLINPHFQRNRQLVNAYNANLKPGKPKRKVFTAAAELSKHASTMRTIRDGMLQVSQLPLVIKLNGKEIHKPEGW